MTPDQRNEVRQLAADKYKGDLEKAALDFLGLDTKTGSEGAVNGIVDECETYKDIDAPADEEKPAPAKSGSEAESAESESAENK